MELSHFIITSQVTIEDDVEVEMGGRTTIGDCWISFTISTALLKGRKYMTVTMMLLNAVLYALKQEKETAN